MTHNHNLKAQVRAHAAARGISYTQARREVLAALHGTGPGPRRTVTRRTVTIQQKDRARGVTPYPYSISEHGFVDQQEFWRGQPFRLIGFTALDEDDHAEAIASGTALTNELALRDQKVVLGLNDLFTDPTLALGSHPVFADRDGNRFIQPGAIESTARATRTVDAPDTVTAHIRFVNAETHQSYNVGHLMWLLDPATDYMGQPSLESIKPASAHRVLDWLTADPAGQDFPELADAAVDTDLLLNLVHHLPERDRHIVTAYYFEQKTLTEIGSELGDIGQSRISQILKRALHHLEAWTTPGPATRLYTVTLSQNI